MKNMTDTVEWMTKCKRPCEPDSQSRLQETPMTKHELAHPHDLLTRFILSDPELAASLLVRYGYSYFGFR